MEIQDILGYMLNTSARFIKRKMDRELETYNLTTSQWAVIKLLDSKKELTQAELADQLSGDRATAGTVIFNLIEKGYVEKKLKPGDRRSYVVSLTQKSRAIVKDIELKAEKISELALKDIDEHDTEIFFRALKKIIENLS
ncbi:MAG: MarR family transcriptional regulator [Bacillota bacterium]|nr:MarR family transcriptional regulator [Bacillota bacterium]